MIYCLSEQEILTEHILDTINSIVDDLLSSSASVKELDNYLEHNFLTISGILYNITDTLFGTSLYDTVTTKKLQQIVKGVPIRVHVMRSLKTNAFTVPLGRYIGRFSIVLLPLVVARAVTSNVSVSFNTNSVTVRNYDGSIYVFYTIMARKILTFDELIALLLHEVGHNIYALKRTRSLIIPAFGSILDAKLSSHSIFAKRKFLILTLCTFIVYLTSLYNRLVVENAADTFVANIGQKYAHDLASALEKIDSEIPSKLPLLIKLARRYETLMLKVLELIMRVLPVFDHPSTAGRIATLRGEKSNTTRLGLMAKLDAIMGNILKKFWQKISS